MIFTRLPLSGAYRVETEPRSDARGTFARMFCVDEFAAHGLNTEWVQSNLSVTIERGTLRGMHFQRPPALECKLVRCSKGAVFDVIADLRAGSPTFGQWVGEELDAERRSALYVPGGCAHGFQTLTADAEVFYLHSARYSSEHEGGVLWSDPDLGIEWPLPAKNLSGRDMSFPRLKELEPIRL
ncbi:MULTISPECIES: dTDP-4-dehydrorhamnose 3,5-epimerase [Rhodophyticola]|jgi:dTDP-4-dehydrorhamnose 3,5-epimerase|uniref:dTDP-4-dehydrorhamnose 3,5-epimerase n=1 Tax=Rhodophyticola TaxID=2680018 RepID=UPI0035CF8248